MTLRYPRLLPALVGGLLMTGCQTLPVVPHALKCEVNTELLAVQCATPRPVANNATYASLVDTMQADRKALRECSLTAEALREAIDRCNRETDAYNQKIDTLNSRK